MNSIRCGVLISVLTALTACERSSTPTEADTLDEPSGASGPTALGDASKDAVVDVQTQPDLSVRAPTRTRETCEDDALTVVADDGRGGTLVVEALRGEANPVEDVMPEYRGLVTPFVIDIRVRDAQRLPVYERLGGDTPIDPSWNLRQNTFERIDVEARHKDFARLGEIAAEMLGEAIVDRCADLREEVIRDLEFVSEEPLVDPDPVQPDTSPLPIAAAPYRHKAHVMYKGAFWNFAGNPADHSALKLNVYDANSALVYIAVTSNHGAAANDPSMSNKCYANFGGRGNQASTMGNGCTTSYGIFGGQHVCNDDTYAEYGNVKYNSSSSWLTCGDGSLRVTAPTCW